MARHLTKTGTGWKYQRAVPRALWAVAGCRIWTRHLRGLDHPAACRKRDALDAHFAALIRRLEALDPKQTEALRRMGGANLVQARVEHNDSHADLLRARAKEHHELAVAPKSFWTDSRQLSQSLTVENEKLRAESALSAAEALNMAERVAAQTASARSILKAIGLTSSVAVPLDNLIADWRRVVAPRSPLTEKRVRMYLRRFSEATGCRDAATVTAEDARRFRDWLAGQESIQKSADKYLGTLHRLYSRAVSEGRVSGNPFEGIEARKDQRRRASDAQARKRFSAEQVRAILSALPADDAAFRWIWHLLLYHGMRSGEVANMRVNAVDVVDGVTVLRITDEEGGSVKNAPSVRDVPLHPACAQFVAFVAAARDRGDEFAFQTMPVWNGGRGGVFQKKSSAFLRGVVGITDSKVTTHSARHYWKALAESVDMPEKIARAIMGHRAGSDVHATTYRSPPSLRKMADWIARIDPRAGP